MTVAQSDVAGPRTAVVTQPNVVGPSSASATEKEACETEAGSDTTLVEGRDPAECS